MHISTRAALAASAAAIVVIHAAPTLAQARYDFNLPVQPLSESLTTVASRSGANIAFKPDIVAGRSAPALAGSYTVDEALGRLLARSGLAATMTQGGSFLVQPETQASAPARSVRASATPVAAISPRVAAAPAAQAAVEEVIVTASRRAANLQDVPISVTAVTARDIERSGVSEARNLTQMVPNLTFSRGNNAFHPTIRGVGTRNTAVGDESTVSVYVDGVYQADMASGSFDLLKVERVEVLRGPQGTLFGRNSTGGLINVITPDPTFDFQGQVKARYGSYDERSLQGYVSAGLSDTVAIDLAALTYRDEGYVRDLVRGGRLGVKESLALRSKLLYRPSDAAKMVLTVNYFDGKDNSAPSYAPLNGNTSGRTGNPNILLPTAPYQSALDVKPELMHKDFGASLQTAFELDAFNVETTLSGQRSEVHVIADSDASPVFRGSNDFTTSTQSFTQELRVLSKSEGRLQWIAGAFGFQSLGRYAPLISNNTTIFYGRTSARSAAGFAELTYQIADNLFIGAGARYTWEQRRFNSTQNGVRRVIGAKTSYDKITPRVFVRYEVTPDTNLYASYSEGFKSGVFGSNGVNPVPVRPEAIKSFEVGVKAQPTPWLRANFAAFDSDYKDIQLSARDVNSTVSALLNAASAKIQGLEGEISLVPTPGLDVRLTAAYLDAKYDDFPRAITNTPLPGNNGNSQSQADVSGARMIRAPKYTFNLGVSYEIPMESGVLGLSGNLYHSGKYYWDFQNRLNQPAYTTVNGEISWAFADERYRVALWGKNLTDEAVFQQMLPSTAADAVAYEKPRTWGVSLEAKF